MMSSHISQAKAHPWHGVSVGADAPHAVNAYIEMVPTDTVKYEIDKESGHLKIDRPQAYSNYCPALYGFIPQTYGGARVGAYCAKRIGKRSIDGDGDPLDICVFTERPVTHGDILVTAIPIGGLRLIDRGEADDKIIAVLSGDLVYGDWRDIKDCSPSLIERLRHYFLTYKQVPHEGKPPKVEITHVYSAAEARRVIELGCKDYAELVGC